jgi:POT family proton-dependent oligopeptide transporter
MTSAITQRPAPRDDDYPPPSAAMERHPRAFWFFFWGEFAERCSYYGMRVILPLYLTSVLRMADTTAGPIYYWFKMACYFLPLLGGYLADRFFGKYWTIVGFSVPYVLGHFILGIPDHLALFVALVLLAGGSGVIKPNISTLMGQTYDQLRPGQEQLRSAAFMWFYFAINIGAVLSALSLPMLRDRWGYAIAFQFPAWLMVASLIVFASGKPYYATEKIEPHHTTPEERRQQWETLGRIFGIFGLMVFFWVAYEQSDSLWVFFIRDYVDRTVPFRTEPIAPDQIGFLNPLFVLILIPLFSVVFKTVDPKARIFTASRKILIGFVLGAGSAAVMSLAGYIAQESGAKVSLGWILYAYILQTVGEVLLYGTGLELAYTMAPKSMKGFVTACFLLSITAANFINSWLARLYGGSLTDPPEARGPLSPAAFFGMTALIVLAATIAFFFVGGRLQASSAGSREEGAETATGITVPPGRRSPP